ncbi:MAG: hypothetical protein JWN07_787 [Hyphomicrobiales bacterium]|nr:hypothetical protein [Hyphomicrobiales bacterium]
MAIKGMQRDRTGHIGPDEWKNDKQNQQRGAHEKGEQAVAAALADPDAQDDATDETDGNRGSAPDTVKTDKGG